MRPMVELGNTEPSSPFAEWRFWRMNCDEHFTWVACNPKLGPGAYAAHTDDQRYRKFLQNWKRRELRKGATVTRVTCNEAQKLMGQFLDAPEPQNVEDK